MRRLSIDVAVAAVELLIIYLVIVGLNTLFGSPKNWSVFEQVMVSGMFAMFIRLRAYSEKIDRKSKGKA